ncbi:MAG TPA: citrate (Si)-synthase [Ignavibacteriales bacterium]|nr:citrate (Si)-synthase [Ignavibacteriales bacterium]
MSLIIQKLEQKIPLWREEINQIVKNYGDLQVSSVNISQVFGGIRGVRTLLCDTSSVPADKGLIIRGIPILNLVEYSPEEIYFLLLTGELPNEEEFHDFKSDLRSRTAVPDYVWQVLETMPKDTHPMVLLSMGILAMERESVFKKAYDNEIHKKDYWKPMLEDAMNIVAKIPTLAAGIYRMIYNKGRRIESDPRLDMASDFIHMLGLIEGHECRFCRLMRLFLVLHSDHEHGTVSAVSSATVNSALSDLYYAVSAGLNGLAGPLHGLANQEALKWILDLINKYGGEPTADDIEKEVVDTINSGLVVPGYGHAVLRVVDPRFTALYNFGEKFAAHDPIFKTVKKVFEVTPNVLKRFEKIKNPWPNVDAISGSLLYHYGLKEISFYTVIFGVSRAMGMTAQAVIARALGMPIIRPKSISTAAIKEIIEQSKK